MAAAGTGWDAAAHRRECTIPPDQLKALNALPGWERTFQAAPLDETPDDSPASSQRGAREKSLAEEPEKTKAVASPGAHARRQRAPVLSFDDEDDEDDENDENDEDERALARADALVRAGRGDANPEMADPQTRGLRGVATADPRAPPESTTSEPSRSCRRWSARAWPWRSRPRARAGDRQRKNKKQKTERLQKRRKWRTSCPRRRRTPRRSEERRAAPPPLSPRSSRRWARARRGAGRGASVTMPLFLLSRTSRRSPPRRPSPRLTMAPRLTMEPPPRRAASSRT